MYVSHRTWSCCIVDRGCERSTARDSLYLDTELTKIWANVMVSIFSLMNFGFISIRFMLSLIVPIFLQHLDLHLMTSPCAFTNMFDFGPYI